MRSRTDPLLPLLGSIVSLLVLGSIAFVIYPRVARLMGPEEESVVGIRPDPDASIPIWIARPEPGVALMLEPILDEPTVELIGSALDGGPYHLMRLTVHNFEGPAGFSLRLPEAGLASPEGGAPAVPVAGLLRSDVDPGLALILRTLGSRSRLAPGPGHFAQALLAVRGSPLRRTAFVSGTLRLERRDLPRRTVAAWLRKPDWETFRRL